MNEGQLNKSGIYRTYLVMGDEYMSTNAYIKYITQQIVQYFNLSKRERKEKRRHRKEDKEPTVSHWFGIVPFALSMFIKRIKKRKQMS